MKTKRKWVLGSICILFLIAYVIKGIVYTIEYDQYLTRPKEILESLRLEDIESVICLDKFYDYDDGVYPYVEFHLSEGEIQELMIPLQDVKVGRWLRVDDEGCLPQFWMQKTDGTTLMIIEGYYKEIILNYVVYRREDEAWDEVMDYLENRARAHYQSNTGS